MRNTSPRYFSSKCAVDGYGSFLVHLKSTVLVNNVSGMWCLITDIFDRAISPIKAIYYTFVTVVTVLQHFVTVISRLYSSVETVYLIHCVSKCTLNIVLS